MSGGREEQQGDTEAREFIVALAERRLRDLEAASDAVDQKAGITLGFAAVVLVLVLQRGLLGADHAILRLLTMFGCGALLVSIAGAIVSILPQSRRWDPNVASLVERYWNASLHETMERTAANMGEAWRFNKVAHGKKVRSFRVALWALALAVLALVIEAMVIH
jgi:hypothetical protein